MSVFPFHLIPFLQSNVKLKTPFDIHVFHRFFVTMKSYAPPDALRAARALTRLSQRELSEQIDFTRQSISSAEKDTSAPLPTVARMRKYFEDRGLQFLGTVDIDTGNIRGAGVRWRPPETFPPEPEPGRRFHTENHGTAFDAARSLLGVNRSTVAKAAGVSLKDLAELEAGRLLATQDYERLRSYYAEVGIEFLGFGDVRSGLYYGVGVRWV
jgi:DNA-binding XRE family transcriptional regulator